MCKTSYIFKVEDEGELKTAVAGQHAFDVVGIANIYKISSRSVWREVARGNLANPVRIGRCARWFAEDLKAFEEKLRACREQTR